MSITHKLLISALTLSTAVGIGISAVQPTAHVSARRTYRVARYHTGYYRRGVWHTYKSGYYNRYWRWVPNRTKRAKRTWHRPRYHKAVRRAIQPRKRTRAKHHLKLYKFTIDGIQDQAYGYKNYRKALAEDTKVDYNYDKGCDPDDPWFVNYVKTHSPKQTHHVTKQSTNNNQSNNLDSTSNPSPEANATVERIAEQRDIQDINNDRIQHGLQPLTNNPQLQQIAEVRAKQDQSTYKNGHIDPNTNEPYVKEVSQALGYGPNDHNENLDATYTGASKYYDNAPTDHPVNTGEDVADYDNQTLMNHDEVADNGHRDNILDKNVTQVGVGVNGKLGSINNGQAYYVYTIAQDYE